jgi:hypothetical protein
MLVIAEASKQHSCCSALTEKVVGTVTLRPSSHYTSRMQLNSVDQHTPLVEYLNEYHFLLFLTGVMEQQLLEGRIVKNPHARSSIITPRRPQE